MIIPSPIVSRTMVMKIKGKAAVGFFFYLSGSLTDIMLQLTFIGLAALTWPHMILVDYMNKQQATL